MQRDFDGGAHEIDDGLGRVDDAVGVGDLDAVALKEALVDHVDEILLGTEVGLAVGYVFNCL